MNFLDEPFGKIERRFSRDEPWPKWIEGTYSLTGCFLKNPEYNEPNVVRKFVVSPLFEKTISREVKIELATDRNVIILSDDKGRLGELWLLRFVRSWRDITRKKYFAETYVYYEIHTDPLTSMIEGTGNRYRVDLAARRSFDVFVSFCFENKSISIHRSQWMTTLVQLAQDGFEKSSEK